MRHRSVSLLMGGALLLAGCSGDPAASPTATAPATEEAPTGGATTPVAPGTAVATDLPLTPSATGGTVEPSVPTTGPPTVPGTPTPTEPPAEPPTGPPPGAGSEVAARGFYLDPGGISRDLADGTRGIVAFDEAGLDETRSVLSEAFGAATSEEDLPECGPGPLYVVSWDNFSAYFSEDTFAGWYVYAGPKSITTVEGIGIGSTRADLEAAFTDLTVGESTIGIEWSGGGYSGTLSSDAADGVVEITWAGLNCVAR